MNKTTMGRNSNAKNHIGDDEAQTPFLSPSTEQRSNSDCLSMAVANQADDIHHADAVAEATIQTLRQVNLVLTPVIGSAGVCSVLKRSLHLSGRNLSWLALTENDEDTESLLASLSARLTGRDKTEVVEAGSVLFSHFTEILETAIGKSLVEMLLDSLCPPPALET